MGDGDGVRKGDVMEKGVSKYVSDRVVDGKRDVDGDGC